MLLRKRSKQVPWEKREPALYLTSLKSLFQSEPLSSAIEVNLTLPYIHAQAVIPAEAGIQLRNTGFRVKPGMTN
jgi:hypothetical protein